eukprot:jgi/Hompol1/2681/HPOL_006128-RA
MLQRVLRDMDAAGFTPHLSDWMLLLEALARDKRADDVVMLFDRILDQHHSISPTNPLEEASFAGLMRVLADIGAVESVEHIVASIVERGVRLSTTSALCLIDSCINAGNLTHADTYILAMGSLSESRLASSSSLLGSQNAGAKSYSEQQKIILKALAKVPPDTHIYSLIITTACRSGKPHLAVTLYNSM